VYKSINLLLLTYTSDQAIEGVTSFIEAKFCIPKFRAHPEQVR